MGGIESPGTITDEPEARQQEPTGAWVGYLIFALGLLFLLALDAESAYYHSWAHFAAFTVIVLALVIVPTGGVTWLWRSLRDRKPPTA
jgi:uncharacterized membrane protein